MDFRDAICYLLVFVFLSIPFFLVMFYPSIFELTDFFGPLFPFGFSN